MIERKQVYVWPSWVTSLISGDKSCVWSAWFKAHFTSYEKVDSDFDLVKWTADHAALVRLRADELRAEGFIVTEEDQNAFKILPGEVRGRDTRRPVSTKKPGCANIAAANQSL